jgi:uncharacterized protein (TIGR03437 family)
MRFILLLLIPTLTIAGEFTTSLGDAYPYMVSAIATDSAGNTYVVGSRALGGGGIFGIIAVVGDLPTVSTSPYYYYGGSDVFVTKLDPNGKVLFTDTFAGKGVDTGTAITIDATGNIYIAGTTTSPDFPLSKALQTQPSIDNGTTGFIIKLTNDGTTILYSTYFGGVLGYTSISSLATDSKGNLYLTGFTTSSDFPHAGNAPYPDSAVGSSGAILAAISAAGDRILYSGAIFAGPIPISGGDLINTTGVGVATDGAGNAYFAFNVGATINVPFGFTGYVTKVDPTGKSIYYANLPGYASALAVDAAGDAYVGIIYSYGMNAPIQVSISKLDPTSNVVWTNNLGSLANAVNSLAVDPSGKAWATGSTLSAVFPNAQGWSTGTDFVVGLNATGSTSFSQLYPTGTVAQSVALDPSGLVHVAGSAGFVSAIAPTTPPSMKIFDFQNAFGGNVTARISPAEVISIYGPGIGPAMEATATPANGFYPSMLAGVQVTINGANIPLLYVSANQINAVVPMELTPNVSATVRVINGASVSPGYPVWIVPTTPQAFPTVLNQDGTVNSQTNPARWGSVVTFYGTGWQSSFSPLADGQVATVAQDACLGSCSVPVSNSTALYAGAAPGIVAGVTQFNIKIGANNNGSIGISVVGPGPTFTTIYEVVWIAP